MANLLLAQVILLCATVLVGCIWWLRRHFQKQPFEGMSQFDHEKIAHEIQDEIMRLRELRNRIYPAAQATDESNDLLLSAPRESAAPDPAVTIDNAALEAKIAADYETRIQKLNARITELEGELKAKNEATTPAPASSGQLEQLQKEFHKDREVLKEQVVHLEKVLAEYKIFEEDFALARRYKAENDQLRKQLSETHNITEDDIASLFKSADPGSENESQLFQADDLAELTNESESTTSNESANPSPDDLMAALTSSSETPAPEQAPSSAETLAESAAEPAPESALESTSEPSVESKTPETPEPSLEAKAENKDFEVEKTQEPELARAIKEGDLEDVAESAVNDDQLIAEFQKILGDQQT
jgi:hypothetical protein